MITKLKESQKYFAKQKSTNYMISFMWNSTE